MIRGICEDVLRSVYDFSDMTDEELRCKFFQKLQECIDLCNNTSEIGEWIKNEGLEKEVNEILSQWKEDGSLVKILDTYFYDRLKEEIVTEINNKINYTVKTFTNLPVNFLGNEIIEAKTSAIINVSLPENVPQTALQNIYFNSPVENGIVYDHRIVNKNTLSIRFTNITDTSITLEDKIIDLKVLY